MINLLPPQEKEALLLEKKRKLIIIFGITLVIPLICLILMLLPIRFYILGEIESQKIVLEQAKQQYQTPDFLMFKDIIQKNNATLLTLDSFYKKELDLNEALKIISSISRPNNVYITNISLSKTPNQKIKAIISGVSDSRDNLLLFQKNIGQITQIQNPYFSPESWVSSKDVRFYLSLEVSP